MLNFRRNPSEPPPPPLSSNPGKESRRTGPCPDIQMSGRETRKQHKSMGKRSHECQTWGLRRSSPLAYVILTPTLPEPEVGMVQSTRELSALTLLVHLPPEAAACNRTVSPDNTASSSSTSTLLYECLRSSLTQVRSHPTARHIASKKGRRGLVDSLTTPPYPSSMY